MSNAVPMEAPKDRVRAMRSVLENPKVIRGIKEVVPSFVTPERLLRICANAVEKTPLLAECSQTSFLSAVMTSCALGLEPNTIAGHAFLIPYKGKRKVDGQWVEVYECQFQMGYKGYIELAYRNEACVSFIGLPVFENDRFRYYVGGDMGELTIDYEAARADRGAIEGSFSLAVFQRTTGARGRASVWMPNEDIAKVRAKSQTYNFLLSDLEKAEADQNDYQIRKARKKFEETPWVAWEPEMYAKSAIRKLAKQLPIFGNVLGAASVEDAYDSGTIDIDAMTDPETVRRIASGEEGAPERHDEDDDGAPAMRTTGPVVIDGGKVATPVKEPARQAKQPAAPKEAPKAEAAAQAPAAQQEPQPEAGQSATAGQVAQGQPLTLVTLDGEVRYFSTVDEMRTAFEDELDSAVSVEQTKEFEKLNPSLGQQVIDAGGDFTPFQDAMHEMRQALKPKDAPPPMQTTGQATAAKPAASASLFSEES